MSLLFANSIIKYNFKHIKPIYCFSCLYLEHYFTNFISPRLTLHCIVSNIIAAAFHMQTVIVGFPEKVAIKAQPNNNTARKSIKKRF